MMIHSRKSRQTFKHNLFSQSNLFFIPSIVSNDSRLRSISIKKNVIIPNQLSNLRSSSSSFCYDLILTLFSVCFLVCLCLFVLLNLDDEHTLPLLPCCNCFIQPFLLHPLHHHHETHSHQKFIQKRIYPRLYILYIETLCCVTKRSQEWIDILYDSKQRVVRSYYFHSFYDEVDAKLSIMIFNE